MNCTPPFLTASLRCHPATKNCLIFRRHRTSDRIVSNSLLDGDNHLPFLFSLLSFSFILIRIFFHVCCLFETFLRQLLPTSAIVLAAVLCDFISL